MKERKTPHPLRTINLRYDPSIPESEYEKQLFESYLALHSRMQELNKEAERLLYLYTEFEDKVKAVDEKFKPVAETLQAFKNEAEVLTTKLKSTEAVNDLMERIQAYYPTVNDFHEEELAPVYNEFENIEKDYNRFNELNEAVNKVYDKFRNETDEFYKNHAKYSLDLTAFDSDFDDFKGRFTKLRDFEKRCSRIVNRYGELNYRVGEAYREWDETKKLASDFYDDGKMLDCSLSESYANGTGDPKTKPKYLMPPGDERIQKFKNSMGLMGSGQNKTLVISVDMDVVKSGQTAYMDELVMTLQHFPKLIEKFLFSVQLNFLNRDGNPMTDDGWKGQPIPMRWISGMCKSVPCIFFFLQDHDARAYFLMGDLILDKRLPVNEADGSVTFEGEGFQEFAQRLFHICWFMLIYCHNTGFDPTPYIESVLADFDIGLSFEHIYKQYEEDIKSGIELKAVPVKDGKPGEGNS